MDPAQAQGRAVPTRTPRRPARAELVGSMVRPPALVEAFRRVFPSRDALGEHPRGQGSEADRRRLDQVTEAEIGALVARDGHGATQTLYVPRIDRPVRRVANPAAQSARLMGSLTDRPFKITSPAASRELAFWGRPVLGPEVYARGIYEDPDEAFAQLLSIERSADLPPEVTTGLHFCRGNVGDKFLAAGALDPVAERVLGSLDYDRLLIEWSDPERHGDFDALRFVGPDTTVVLGIVDTKSGEVETEDQLLATIEAAARHLDVARLAISPQCGFSSAVGINDAIDVQWRKIEVMCRVADRVWG